MALKSSLFEARAVHYFSNGSGRDSYIVQNNGGLFQYPAKAAQFSIGSISQQHIHRPLNNYLPAKNIHYHSDGSGRDKYIIVNEGGLIDSSKRFNYLNNLRNYSKKRIHSEEDFFSNVQFSPNQTNFLKTQSKFRQQTQDSKRLSQPRYAEDPYREIKQKLTLPSLRRIY